MVTISNGKTSLTNKEKHLTCVGGSGFRIKSSLSNNASPKHNNIHNFKQIQEDKPFLYDYYNIIWYPPVRCSFITIQSTNTSTYPTVLRQQTCMLEMELYGRNGDAWTCTSGSINTKQKMAFPPP